MQPPGILELDQRGIVTKASSPLSPPGRRHSYRRANWKVLTCKLRWSELKALREMLTSYQDLWWHYLKNCFLNLPKYLWICYTLFQSLMVALDNCKTEMLSSQLSTVWVLGEGTGQESLVLTKEAEYTIAHVLHCELVVISFLAVSVFEGEMKGGQWRDAELWKPLVWLFCYRWLRTASLCLCRAL